MSKLGSLQLQHDFTAARLAARVVVCAWLDVDPDWAALYRLDIRQRCDRCGGPHGRPRLHGIRAAVSWAHSSGWVAAAVGAHAVGIDVEVSGDQAARVGGMRPWVRGEALVKWGHGTVDDIGGWASSLDWPDRLDGQSFWVRSGHPPRPGRQRRLARRGKEVVMTDVRPQDSVLCAVVAARKASVVGAVHLLGCLD